MYEDGSALWVWIGVGFYGDLVSGIQLGGKESFLNSAILRKQLKALHFGPGEENRDPFNDQISYWWQKASGELRGSGWPCVSKKWRR
jgi:hypothetical protein